MVVDRSTVMLGLLAAFALVALAVLGVVLAYERRAFARDGKARAWLFVRVAALPLLAATVAVVLLPARAISGMEALAAFYGLLFTAAPLVWFGGHWLVGRAARPALTSAESLRLAATLPAFLIASALVAQALQPFAWSVTLAAERAGYEMAEETPARHAVAAARRWATPTGDVTLVRWQAPGAVHVERIDVHGAGGLSEHAQRAQMQRVCQAPGTIVLVQPAREPLPSVRVWWREPDTGRLHVATLPSPQAIESATFDVAWRGDGGFDLPEPLPRLAIWLAREHDPAGTFLSSEAQAFRPGETFDDSCLPDGWRAPTPIRGLRVRVDGPTSAEPLWLEAVRRTAGPDAAS